MFYAQFILAKKGALGTIWVAAHFDRKLHKKQIAETDIDRSVAAILDPGAPIALRLSGHLLLGVVRVYSRKVAYLFNDCSDALLKIKQAFRPGAVDLPPEAATAAYNSITIPENFDIDELEYLPGYGQDVTRVWKDLNVTDLETITLAPKETAWNFFDPSSQLDPDATFGQPVEGARLLDVDEEPDNAERLRAATEATVLQSPLEFQTAQNRRMFGSALEDEEMLAPMDESSFPDEPAPADKGLVSAQPAAEPPRDPTVELDAGGGGGAVPVLEDPLTPLPVEVTEQPQAEKAPATDAGPAPVDASLQTPLSGGPLGHDVLPDVITPSGAGLDANGVLDQLAPSQTEREQEEEEALDRPSKIQRRENLRSMKDALMSQQQTPAAPPSSQPRNLTQMQTQTQMAKKRKGVVDAATVINALVMRAQLERTDDIRRVRRKAEHAHDELRLSERQAQGLDPFAQPSIPGVPEQLRGLFQRLLLVDKGRALPPRKAPTWQPSLDMEGHPPPPEQEPQEPLSTPLARAKETGRAKEVEQQDGRGAKGVQQEEEGERAGESQEIMAGTHVVADWRASEAFDDLPQMPGPAEVGEAGEPVAGAAAEQQKQVPPLDSHVDTTEMHAQAQVPPSGVGGEEAAAVETAGAGARGLEGTAGLVEETVTAGDKAQKAGGTRADAAESPLEHHPDSTTFSPKEAEGISANARRASYAAQEFANGLDFLLDRDAPRTGRETDDLFEDDQADTGKKSLDDGWSARTKSMGRFFKTSLESMGAMSTLHPQIGIHPLIRGKTRNEASRFFFEVLLLTTRDYVRVQQDEPYGEIMVTGTPLLMKSTL